jgi:hypothetical protein
VSRHAIASTDESRFTVVVGYDRPIDAYFATVYNAAATATGKENIIAWLWETVSLQGLRKFLAPYAEIEDGVLREIAAERIKRARVEKKNDVDCPREDA